MVSIKALEDTQEGVQNDFKNNILTSNVIYVCTEHGKTEIDNYFQILDSICICENDSLSIDLLLEGAICHSGFKRLN